ncbi:MAG: hypothetical protein R2940_04725 [Syntrophotaleaceae bacterium]
MTEQVIAKKRRRVRFTLIDGSEVEGDVFLWLYEVRHFGPQKVGELLNGESGFIPVATVQGLVHLNVVNIVTVRATAEEEWDDLDRLGKNYTVRIRTRIGEISGEMFVNLPAENSRVSDCLSQADRFLRIFCGDEIIYIGTRFVLSVQD